jgi:hypothetical protein
MLAAAFLRTGYRVLADDMSCCRLDPEPSVLPGPAILRIRHDVYSRLELTGTEPVLRDEDKSHPMQTAAARGSGEPVPIRAIVFVRDTSLQAVEGRPAISAVAAADSLANLWSVGFTLPTAEGAAADDREGRCVGQQGRDVRDVSPGVVR